MTMDNNKNNKKQRQPRFKLSWLYIAIFVFLLGLMFQGGKKEVTKKVRFQTVCGERLRRVYRGLR